MTCCPTSTKGGNLRRSIDTRPCRRSKTSRLCVGNLSSFTASAVTRSATNALTLVTGRIGYDVSGYPLDGPVPPPPPSEGGRTFHRVLYDMARRQNMTLRDLYNLTAAARGHWVICGTPTGIADTLEQWFVEGAADGYNPMNCAVVAYQSSMQRSPPVRRPGSGACPFPSKAGLPPR